jgi:hypothetical protein
MRVNIPEGKSVVEVACGAAHCLARGAGGEVSSPSMNPIHLGTRLSATLGGWHCLAERAGGGGISPSHAPEISEKCRFLALDWQDGLVVWQRLDIEAAKTLDPKA